MIHKSAQDIFTMYFKQLALMRISNQSSDHFNSIDRDLIIVFVTGFILAIAIVLVGIVLINQI